MLRKTIVFAFAAIAVSFSHSRATTWADDFSKAIIKRHPGTIDEMTNKGWEYSNSTVLHGIEKIFDRTKNADYLNYIKKYVDKFVDASGNVDYDASKQSLDKVHPGVLCLFLFKETGEDKYKKAADKMLDAIKKQPRNPSGGFWHKSNYPNQMWLDGIYMAEPFVAKYGYRFNEGNFCDTTPAFQMLLLSSHAYIPAKKLLVHGWDETKKAEWAKNTSDGLSPEIWSRGMGWYAMAMVDVLKYLPKNHPKYSAMITLFGNIAEGLKATQDPATGLWYQVVDKGGQSKNWLETSGSCMFVYALRLGVLHGFIDKQYMAVAEKGWEGLKKRIMLDAQNLPVIHGFVGAMGILANYSAYVDKLPDTCPKSVHPHGYCAILMAAGAMEAPAVPKYRLTVSVSGTGKVANSSGEMFLDSGATTTLTATPGSGVTFSKWSGDGSGSNAALTVTMNAEKSITAVFSDGTSASALSPLPAIDGGVRCRSSGRAASVSFTLSKQRSVVIELFNSNGTRVCRASSAFGAGSHRVGLNARDLVPGSYFVKVSFDGKSSADRLMILE